MTTPQELITLAERVKRATGPDREIDQAVFCGLGLAPFVEGAFDAYRAPEYTASLDAAMTLAQGTNLSLAMLMEAALKRFSQESYSSYADDKEALARFFTAACLRAHATNLERDNG